MLTGQHLWGQEQTEELQAHARPQDSVWKNTTRAAVKKYMLAQIAADKCISFYGHTYNFGITGHLGIPPITFTIISVDIANGAGTIVVQGTLPINEGVYEGTMSIATGSGDAAITFSEVGIDTIYTQNTLTVTGVTTPPLVGDTYTYQADDEWNFAKLEDILQFAIQQQSLGQCVVMPPDDAYQYYF